MTRGTISGLALATLLALLARADEAARDLAGDGVREFNAAYRAWDGGRFAAAAALFRQACTNAPTDSTNFYWLGVTEFHRMLQVQSLPPSASNNVAAAAGMEAALAALATAVKLEPDQAECHALLGTLYGMKIGGNLIRGARFGPRVAGHQKQALQFGAANPRVQYLLGTCLFHTAKNPARQREALAALLQAEKLFESEATTPAAPLEPRWGYSACLTFIGRTYEQLGEPARAETYYRRALAVHPADHLAGAGLARVAQRK